MKALQPNQFIAQLIDLLHEATDSIGGNSAQQNVNSNSFAYLNATSNSYHTDNESSLSSGYDSSFVSNSCSSVDYYYGNSNGGGYSNSLQSNNSGRGVILCSSHFGELLVHVLLF